MQHGYFPTIHVENWRTIDRQTTHHRHLDGYPKSVTIVRARHPLEGKPLEVFGWQRQRSQLLLMLVLPDGTLSLIPASWTDLRSVQKVPGKATRARAAVLAEIGYLLQACTVIKPLLERIAAATPKAAAAPHNKR